MFTNYDMQSYCSMPPHSIALKQEKALIEINGFIYSLIFFA